MKSFQEFLPPSVVLVHGADIGDLDAALHQVAGHGDVIHRAMSGSAKDIFEFVLFEDARGAAVEENKKLLERLGCRRDRQAVARADIAQDRVDMVALKRVAQFLDLLGGATCLVNELNFDFQAAKADFVVGFREASGIERIDDGLRALHGRLAERFSSLPGEERDEGQFEDVVVLRSGAAHQRTQDAGAGDQRGREPTKFHGHNLPM